MMNGVKRSFFCNISSAATIYRYIDSAEVVYLGVYPNPIHYSDERLQKSVCIAA